MSLTEKLGKVKDYICFGGYAAVSSMGPVPGYAFEVLGLTGMMANYVNEEPKNFAVFAGVYVAGRVWNNFRQRIKAEDRHINSFLQSSDYVRYMARMERGNPEMFEKIINRNSE